MSRNWLIAAIVVAETVMPTVAHRHGLLAYDWKVANARAQYGQANYYGHGDHFSGRTWHYRYGTHLDSAGVTKPGWATAGLASTSVDAGKEPTFLRGGLILFEEKGFYVENDVLPPGYYTVHIQVLGDGSGRFCFLAAEEAFRLGGVVQSEVVVASVAAQGKLMTVNVLSVGRLPLKDQAVLGRQHQSQGESASPYSARRTLRVSYGVKRGKPGKQGGKAWTDSYRYGDAYRRGLEPNKADEDDMELFPVPAIKVSPREKGFTLSYSGPEGYLTADLPYAAK